MPLLCSVSVCSYVSVPTPKRPMPPASADLKKPSCMYIVLCKYIVAYVNLLRVIPFVTF